MRMRHMNALRLLSLVLVVTVGASCGGCGGGSGGKKTTAEEYAEYLKIPDSARRANKLIALSEKQESLSDRQGAKQSREAASVAANKIQGVPEQIDALLNLAAAFATAGDRTSAKKTYGTAEEVMEEIDTASAKARFLVRLAKLKLDVDRRDGAEFAANDLKAAEELLGDINLPTDKIEVLMLMSEGYGRVEDTEAAKRIAEELVALPDSIDDWSAKSRALVAVAAAQRDALGDADTGMKTLDTARQLVEGVDLGGNNEHRLKKAFRLYDVGEGYINAGNGGKAREILDAANEMAMQDPEGGQLVDKINQLRGRL